MKKKRQIIYITISHFFFFVLYNISQRKEKSKQSDGEISELIGREHITFVRKKKRSRNSAAHGCVCLDNGFFQTPALFPWETGSPPRISIKNILVPEVTVRSVFYEKKKGWSLPKGDFFFTRIYIYIHTDTSVQIEKSVR